MNANNLFLAQRLRTAESNISAAISRVGRVKTLAELMSARHVSLPAELRSVIRSQSSFRKLQAEVTARARHLVDLDMAYLKSLKPEDGQSKEEFLKSLRHAYGVIRADKWRHLQGHEPLVLTQACQQAEQLLAERTRE